MKARVKGTTDIIEVEFDKDALNACYPPYHNKEHDMYYQPEQLEWVDDEVNAEPDYWTRLEHTYAGMAMQGILTDGWGSTYISNPKSKEQHLAIVTNAATEIAHALVEKMKEGRE